MFVAVDLLVGAGLEIFFYDFNGTIGAIYIHTKVSLDFFFVFAMRRFCLLVIFLEALIVQRMKQEVLHSNFKSNIQLSSTILFALGGSVCGNTKDTHKKTEPSSKSAKKLKSRECVDVEIID